MTANFPTSTCSIHNMCNLVSLLKVSPYLNKSNTGEKHSNQLSNIEIMLFVVCSSSQKDFFLEDLQDENVLIL